MRAFILIALFILTSHAEAQTCASVFSREIQAPGHSSNKDDADSVKAYNKTKSRIFEMNEESLSNLDQVRELSFELGRNMGISRHDIEAALEDMVADGSIGGERHLTTLFQGVTSSDPRGKPGLRERAMYSTKSDLKKQFQPAFDLRSVINERAHSLASSLRQQQRTKSPNKGWGHDWRNEAILFLWMKASMRTMLKAAIDAAPLGTTGVVGKVTNGKQNHALMANVGKELSSYVHTYASEERSSLPAPKLTPLDLNKPDELLSFNLVGELSYQKAKLEAETGETESSLKRIQGSIIPMLRLGLETFEVQIQRLDQIETKIKEIENPKDAQDTQTAAKKIRTLAAHAARDMNNTVEALNFQRTILRSAVEDAASFPALKLELQHWLDYLNDKQPALIERTQAKLKAIDAHTFTRNKELLNEEPKLAVPVVIAATTPKMTGMEISKLLQEVPERELNDFNRLREYSIEFGEKLGLSKVEVTETIEMFVKNGQIGGRPHLFSLYEGVEAADHRVESHDYELKAFYITRGELKSSFKQSANSPKGIAAKAQRMAREMARKAFRLADLNPWYKDERKIALLELWTRASMRPMMKAAIDAAPTATSRAMAHLPALVQEHGFKWTIGGTIGLMSLMHPGLLGGAEILAGGFGAFVTGLKFPNSKAAQWLTKRYHHNREKLTSAGNDLKQLAIPAASSQVLLPHDILPEFDLNVESTPLSGPLMLEVSKQDIDGENLLQLFTGNSVSAVSLAHTEDIAVPIIRLSLDTYELQSARFHQLEAKINEFETKFGGVTPLQRSAPHAEKVEAHAESLRHHLNELKRDISYTLFALTEQRKALASAVKSSARFPMRTTQLQYFLDFAINAEKRITEKVAPQVRAIDARRKELAAHIPFALE